MLPLLALRKDREWRVRQRVHDTLQQVCAMVDTVTFGAAAWLDCSAACTLQDLDVTDLDIPLPALQRLFIAADTHDFYLVERFMTYAVNIIGQQRLKDQVDVHIYGDPDKIQQNLLHNFQHLCKHVISHDDIAQS